MGLQGQYFDPQDRNASPESLDYQDLAAHMNETVPIQVEVGINVKGKTFTVKFWKPGMIQTLGSLGTIQNFFLETGESGDIHVW